MNELIFPSPWMFDCDRNLHLQKWANTLWRVRLRRPASCALHPHREVASHPQVQGLDLEEDTPTLEHSTYNFDEFSMLLQFLNVTSSEFFTQPKCPMGHPPQASTPASELSSSYTSNPTTVLKTNTHLYHPHYLIPRLAPSALRPALFFLQALYHPRGTNSSASETYSGLEWL